MDLSFWLIDDQLWRALSTTAHQRRTLLQQWFSQKSPYLISLFNDSKLCLHAIAHAIQSKQRARIFSLSANSFLSYIPRSNYISRGIASAEVIPRWRCISQEIAAASVDRRQFSGVAFWQNRKCHKKYSIRQLNLARSGATYFRNKNSFKIIKLWATTIYKSN